MSELYQPVIVHRERKLGSGPAELRLQLTSTSRKVSFSEGRMGCPTGLDLLLWSCVWKERTVLDAALGTRCKEMLEAHTQVLV